MRFYSQIIKLIFALFLAKFIADQIGTDSNILIYAVLLTFIYLFFVPWKQKFIIFTFMIFYPFELGRGFPLPLKYWSEALAIILFFLFFVELLFERKPLLSKKASILFSAVGILLLWAIINYIKNPVGGQTFGAKTIGEVGLRAYLIIVTSTCTFFVSYWFFRYKEINIERWFFMLLISALIIGNLRLIGVKIPLLGHNFELMSGEDAQYVSIGGLRLTALMTISTIFTLYYKRKLGFFPIFVFINAIVFSVFSGGRGMFWGIVVTLGLYFILIKRKHIFPVLAVLLILGSMYQLVFSDISFDESKYGRVFALKGGIKEQNKLRYYFYLYMWEVFMENPLFGKGIGFQEISANTEFFQTHNEARGYRVLIEEGLMAGSHGSYMSILSTFGIGGLFFITVMTFGTIYYARRIVIRSSEYQDNEKLALFVFMYVSVMSVHMITGGEGYTYRDMWFLPGIIAAIMAKDQRDKTEILNA
jgi:hypothetical protein